ncbi:hypothetical protein AXF42_Ash020039 [Apostasia shenzhenica]|uniref:Uncharacterized protein n=1 Tax=Apostasia shenzhenica TaxID=1088818 RepID=A0A2I0B4P9_9ASPA|nr:hypothetical protein AXF42_Ash020039 [Apostasia shenzhenica]
MLQLFFVVAFSVAPLTLYMPPVRALTLREDDQELLLGELRVYEPCDPTPTRWVLPRPLSASPGLQVLDSRSDLLGSSPCQTRSRSPFFFFSFVQNSILYMAAFSIGSLLLGLPGF